MPLPTDPTTLSLYHELFTRANSEELGLAVETNNVHALTNNLSEFRKSYPEFKDIIIAHTSNPEVMFLVKQEVELD